MKFFDDSTYSVMDALKRQNKKLQKLNDEVCKKNIRLSQINNKLKGYSSDQIFYSGVYIIMTLFLVGVVRLISASPPLSLAYMSFIDLFLTVFFSLVAYSIACCSGKTWESIIYQPKSKNSKSGLFPSKWLLPSFNSIIKVIIGFKLLRIPLTWFGSVVKSINSAMMGWVVYRSLSKHIKKLLISIRDKSSTVFLAAVNCDYWDVVVKTTPIILGMFLVKFYFLGFPLFVFDSDVIFISCYLLISVPLQEIVSRGFIQSVLNKLFLEYYTLHCVKEGNEVKPYDNVSNFIASISILVANLIFTVAHLHLGFIFSGCSMVCGFLWGYIYYRQQNLIAPIFSHFLVGIGLCLLQMGKLTHTIIHLAVVHNQLVVLFSHPVTVLCILGGASGLGLYHLNRVRVFSLDNISQTTEAMRVATKELCIKDQTELFNKYKELEIKSFKKDSVRLGDMMIKQSFR